MSLKKGEEVQEKVLAGTFSVSRQNNDSTVYLLSYIREWPNYRQFLPLT